MKTQAKWRGHKFGVSKEQIKALEDLAFTHEADTTEGPTLNGKKSIKIKGLALETLSLEYTTAPAVGGDPLAEYEALKKDLGEAGFLYIGGTVYGKGKFLLNSVNLSGLEIDNRGAFLLAKIKIDFIENGVETTTDKEENRAEIGTTGKKSAVNVGPTKAEKKKIVSEKGARNVARK